MKTRGTKVLAAAVGAAVAFGTLMLNEPTALASPSPMTKLRPIQASKHLLAAPMHGRDAVRALGANLGEAAAVNGRTPASLRKLLSSDPTMWLDRDGHLYVREALPTAADLRTAQATSTTTEPALSQTATFALHSNPGSQHTIYLDFVGATLHSGTFWTDGSIGPGVPTGTYAPWDIDGSPAFSTTELASIYEVWQRVSEHYAAFDVDVTTQAPSESALVRSSTSDQTYGDRVLFANTMLDNAGYASTATAWQAICNQQCAGVATIGSIMHVGSSATDEHYQPAWVFTRALGGFPSANFPKWMADDAAHEVGHTFGLEHQGTATKPCPGSVRPGCGYFDGYSGSGSEPSSWLWGPLMGDPYAAAVTQWAHGEYGDANNPQDELAQIVRSAPVRTASAGTLQNPTALPAGGASGVITSSTDHEYYALGTCSGAMSVTTKPAPLGPSLNVQLTLLDSSFTPVASQTPHPALGTDSNDAYGTEPLATNMSDTVSLSGASGQYYLEVSGGGSYAEGGDGAADPISGFSTYGSVGPYSLTGATGCTPTQTPPSAPTALQLNAGCSGQELTWKAPADAGNAAITRYEVSVDNGGWKSMGLATTAIFRGISSGHTYSVRAVNSAASGSGLGAISSVTIPGALGSLIVQYDAANSTSTSDAYDLAWTVPSGSNPLVVEGYKVLAPDSSLVGTTSGLGVVLSGPSGQHPTITVVPFNAAGTGTASSIALQNGATAWTGSTPVPSTYTGTPTSYCPALPSVPRSVHLARGAIGGALTTVGTWVKPSVAAPAVSSYQVRIQTRNRYGRITSTKLVTTSHLKLSIAGTRTYTYRIQVRAHNTTGWGKWSGYTVWVAPR